MLFADTPNSAEHRPNPRHRQTASRKTQPASTSRQHPGILGYLSGCLVGTLMLAVMPESGYTRTLYECSTASGVPSYQQTPCRDEGRVLVIDTSPMGYAAPRPIIQATPVARRDAGASRADPKPVKMQLSEAQIERCWKRQDQLDDANRKLRSGYKASERDKLHKQRERYEMYVNHYCKTLQP